MSDLIKSKFHLQCLTYTVFSRYASDNNTIFPTSALLNHIVHQFGSYSFTDTFR